MGGYLAGWMGGWFNAGWSLGCPPSQSGSGLSSFIPPPAPIVRCLLDDEMVPCVQTAWIAVSLSWPWALRKSALPTVLQKPERVPHEWLHDRIKLVTDGISQQTCSLGALADIEILVKRNQYRRV